MVNDATRPRVRLCPVRDTVGAARTELLTAVARLSLAPGQEAFVGRPAAMLQLALADPTRHPFAILPGEGSALPGGTVLGMGVLQRDAACDAGWPVADDAVLLRGFLIERGYQGHGYGRAATEAAVALAERMVRAEGWPARGVVLGVNERNEAGYAAYRRAGFAPHGTKPDGRSGPAHIMFHPFVNKH